METKEQTARRRLTQGMTAEERMAVFRRAGVKLGPAEEAAMRRTSVPIHQAFMMAKKEMGK